MFLRSLRPASIILLAACAVSIRPTLAQPRDFTLLARPGLTTAALRGDVLRPFTEATGLTVADATWDGTLEQLRTRKEADLVLLRGDVLLAACDEGLLEKIDWAAVGGRDHYVSFATSDCGVGAALYATVLAWDREKFQGTPTWSDFWDVAKYPGKRALRKGARGNLEAALMADGVAASDIYRTLRTGDGLDRAFRKLDQLRPYIVWWEDDPQAIELIGSGEVLMGSAPAAALAGAHDGARKFGLQWAGALIGMESWAVPKGAALARVAQQVIYFAGTPAIEALVLTKAGLAGLAKGATDGVAPEIVAASPLGPGVLAGGLAIDEGFWRDNGDKLAQRFTAWLAH